MKRFAILAVVTSMAAACDQPPTSLTDVDPSFARSTADACAPTDLASVQEGKILRHDCLFGDGQREDLYRVDQLGLGLPDLSGASMLTFVSDATFNGIYGVSRWDETTFGNPVYGYRTFERHDSRTMSVIGSAPEYKLFFSGADATSYGVYSLTTSVQPSANTCEAGHVVFLAGNVSFDGSITDANSCEGTVAVGPNAGQPLIYQWWYGKLTAGQEVTVTVTGVDGDEPTITLAAILWGRDFAHLDFSGGPGDTDRSVSFTAPFFGWYYFEVSSAPGVSSPYSLTYSSD